MKKLAGFVALILSLGLLAGCGSTDTNFTAANNGQPVSIHVGGKVVVTLDANPSTGFTWDVAEIDGNILKQVGQTDFNSASTTPLPGGGGTQTLRFQAIAPGTTNLKLIYHRPFEQNTPPAQTFSVQVTVAP
jgi:inhibitor of cysteine peptidase